MAKCEKMNCREFKDILNNAGIDFGIFGYDGIINIIISYYDGQAEKEKEAGLVRCASVSERRRDTLFDQMMERGFYD